MKEELLKNISKVHTTELGEKRIQKNLQLQEKEVVSEIKELIQKKECKTLLKGKNIYCKIENITITINKNNYCIITAHRK